MDYLYKPWKQRASYRKDRVLVLKNTRTEILLLTEKKRFPHGCPIWLNRSCTLNTEPGPWQRSQDWLAVKPIPWIWFLVSVKDTSNQISLGRPKFISVVFALIPAKPTTNIRKLFPKQKLSSQEFQRTTGFRCPTRNQGSLKLCESSGILKRILVSRREKIFSFLLSIPARSSFLPRMVLVFVPWNKNPKPLFVLRVPRNKFKNLLEGCWSCWRVETKPKTRTTKKSFGVSFSVFV